MSVEGSLQYFPNDLPPVELIFGIAKSFVSPAVVRVRNGAILKAQGGNYMATSTRSRTPVFYPSHLTLYRQCPERYFHKYFERRKVEEHFRPALARGNVAHAILAQCFDQYRRHRTFPIDLRERVEALLPPLPYPDERAWRFDVAAVLDHVKFALIEFVGDRLIGDAVEALVRVRVPEPGLQFVDAPVLGGGWVGGTGHEGDVPAVAGDTSRPAGDTGGDIGMQAVDAVEQNVVGVVGLADGVPDGALGERGGAHRVSAGALIDGGELALDNRLDEAVLSEG